MKTIPLLLCLAAACLGGCAEPAAVVDLVGAADQALGAVSDADGQIEKAMLAQIDGQATRLDEAFMSDMEARAGEQGCLSIDDVRDGKSLYDSKRSALDASRRDLQEAFRRRAASLEAARQLLRYANDLVVRNRASWDDARQYMQFVIQSQQLQSSPK